MPALAILDYGMGNIRSIFNALAFLDLAPLLITDAAQIADCQRLIIPGVGAYARAMDNLRDRGLDRAIEEHWRQQKPLLGICLGMQLLSTIGWEPRYCKGLGIIPGEVKQFVLPPEHKIPHVGWNCVERKFDHPVFDGVKSNVDFYFVHSFCFTPQDGSDVLATTDYGGGFVSAVAKGSAVGLQFHPEKSQANGLKMLENFGRWDGRC